MAKGGFRGGMGGGNMMKQAQKMQEEFMKMQQELESKEFTSTVGGGAVKATMIGTRALKSIEIDPSAVDPDDVEMLQDMIVAAVNEAITQSENATQRGNEQAHPHGLSVLKNENLAPSNLKAPRFFLRRCEETHKKKARKHPLRAFLVGVEGLEPPASCSQRSAEHFFHLFIAVFGAF